MIVLHIQTVLKITTVQPFGYNGKKGFVSGFECYVMAETMPDELGAESLGLAKVQVRAASVDLLQQKIEKLGIVKGQPVTIKLRLFDVGFNEMYSVNAA